MSTLDRLVAENWKPVVGYEGLYEVSDLGRIRRVRAYNSTHSGKVLKPSDGPGGYQLVMLYKHGVGVSFRVHRLVATAFLGLRQQDVVNHKDFDRTNNQAANLEACSVGHNTRHALASGRGGTCKTDASRVRWIRSRLNDGVSIRELCRSTGLHKATIAAIKSGQSWGWLR